MKGVRKEDVKVQLEDGNVLQISGERRKEDARQGGEEFRRQVAPCRAAERKLLKAVPAAGEFQAG